MKINTIGILITENPDNWELFQLIDDSDKPSEGPMRSAKTLDLVMACIEGDRAFDLTNADFFILCEGTYFSDPLAIEAIKRIKQSIDQKVTSITVLAIDSLRLDLMEEVDHYQVASGGLTPQRVLTDTVTDKDLKKHRDAPWSRMTVDSTPNKGKASQPMGGCSMMVLGGFIAVLGIAAVAVAFTVLNAATLGIPGLVVAGIGAVAILTGMGFFGAGLKRKNSEIREQNHRSFDIPDSSPPVW